LWSALLRAEHTQERHLVHEGKIEEREERREKREERREKRERERDWFSPNKLPICR
jgi:hypothetical protein